MEKRRVDGGKGATASLSCYWQSRSTEESGTGVRAVENAIASAGISGFAETVETVGGGMGVFRHPAEAGFT